jgi:hypothetical protein
MLVACVSLEPVIDCAGRNRCGQRPKVAWRRAGDGRELAEAPVGYVGGATRRLANDEIVGVGRLSPEFAGLDRALFDPRVPCTGGFVERVNAGVPFIGWARGPFPMTSNTLIGGPLDARRCAAGVRLPEPSTRSPQSSGSHGIHKLSREQGATSHAAPSSHWAASDASHAMRRSVSTLPSPQGSGCTPRVTTRRRTARRTIRVRATVRKRSG